MKNYTTYCSSEQTQRASQLGAPIDMWLFVRTGGTPTTQQMLGWLKERLGITTYQINCSIADGTFSFYITHKNQKELGLFGMGYKSFDDAVSASIDAALDYLEFGGK